MSLHDKVAIVTGASKGLGAAIAKELASEGCGLCLVGRNVADLENVQKHCQLLLNEKKKVIVVKGDLTDENIRKNVVESTLGAFKKIDILINNAGIMKIGTLEQSSLEDFDNIFDINFRVPYDLCRRCLSYLIESKGCVINMSSCVSVRPNYVATAYSISKCALDQLTTCLAAEVGSKQVRVISINPGVIATDLWKLEGLTEEQSENYMMSLQSRHALNRIGKPEEVAKIVATMVSNSASFITGSRIHIDGGFIAMAPS